MKEHRMQMSCGVLMDENELLTGKIVVFGQQHSKSVEQLNLLRGLVPAHWWEYGPNAPIEAEMASLTQVGPSILVLIGGKNYKTSFDTIIMLKASNKGDLQWTVLDQKLSRARHLHSAIMIPDILANC